MTHTQAHIVASRHFLTDELPENWDRLSGSGLNRFVEDHAWEPLEGYPSSVVWESISSLADDFKTHSV